MRPGAVPAGRLVALALLACQASGVLRYERSRGRLESVSHNGGGGDHAAAAAARSDDAPPQKYREQMRIADTLRALICWGNPFLLENTACMMWMTWKCREFSTGLGVCRKLAVYLDEECEARTHEQEACGYMEALGTETPCCAAVQAEQAKLRAEAQKPQQQPQPLEVVEPGSATIGPPTPPGGAGAATEETKAQTTAYPSPDPPMGLAPAPGPVAEGAPFAPAPSPASAPGASPAPYPSSEPGPSPSPAPWTQDMLDKSIPEWGLPEQGFHGDLVLHKDAETHTSDWGHEWPHSGEESDQARKEKICRAHPELLWCTLYLEERDRHRQESSKSWFRGWLEWFGLA